MNLIKHQQALLVSVMMVIVFIVTGFFVLYTLKPHDDWKTDFSRTGVDSNQIITVGNRDDLLPIDAPRWQAVDTVDWLGDKSPVITLLLDNASRAYPIAVLMKHGVVNDVIGDKAIAVTFCSLCNAPIVYERTVDGHTLRFGVTGAIRHSGMLMWDNETESWWQQFTGEAIVGKYMGTRLAPVPSQVVSYQVFKARYPNGSVLVGDDHLPVMSYGRNPYIGYDSNPQPLLYNEDMDTRLFATERVLATVINGQAIAYPFTDLSQVQVLNDRVQGVPLVAFWQSGASSTHDRASIDQSRDVGMAMLFSPILEGQTLTFVAQNGVITDTNTQSQWTIFGESSEGPLRGAMLMPFPATTCFWFSWAVNYPQTLIYGQ